MYELKIGKVFKSKFVGTGPSSYEKRIYRAAVSQRLRNSGLEHPTAFLCRLRDIKLYCAIRTTYWPSHALNDAIKPTKTTKKQASVRFVLPPIALFEHSQHPTTCPDNNSIQIIMIIGDWSNDSDRGKPGPLLLDPPQVCYILTTDRTRDLVARDRVTYGAT